MQKTALVTAILVMKLKFKGAGDEKISVWFRSNDSRFGGVLVFGFFILRSIFLILSPKNEVYLDNHHNYGCDGPY